MTEGEAKKKWCCGGPMMLLAASVADSPMLPSEGKCVASSCMAWRATYGTQQQPKIGEFSDDGYCGLAGKP